MIPIRAFVELAKALPKAYLKNSGSGIFIYDSEDEMIGFINMVSCDIIIFESYQYAAQVREAIGEDKFTDTRKDFEIQEPPVKITDGRPVLTGYGKLLYEGNDEKR